MKWVRPLIIAGLSAAVTAGFFTDRVAGETFVGFATGLVVYWFKDRSDGKRKGKR